MAILPVEDARLRDRFDREFPAAFSRNREFYSQMSGSGALSEMRAAVYSREELEQARRSGKLRASTDQTGGVVVQSHAFSFAMQGPLKKVKLTALVKKKLVYQEPGSDRLTTKEDPTPKPNDDAYSLARCAGRDASFRVLWKSEGAPPTLEDYQVGPDTGIANRIEIDFANYIKCIYKGWNMKEDYFSPDTTSFKIKGVTPRVKDGLDLAHVEFEIEYPKEPAPKSPDNRYSRGWFDAIPGQGWVIREGALGIPRMAETVAFKVEFDGSQDGFPLPKRVTRYWSTGREIAEFDRIRHGMIPESEFTPAAFGLPKIDQIPEPPGPNRMAYGLIGIGALILAAAIGIKVYARRFPHPRQA
jgi:hypothetical protein